MPRPARPPVFSSSALFGAFDNCFVLALQHLRTLGELLPRLVILVSLGHLAAPGVRYEPLLRMASHSSAARGAQRSTRHCRGVLDAKLKSKRFTRAHFWIVPITSVLHCP